MNTEERLDELKRTNRRWRLLACAFALLLALAVIISVVFLGGIHSDYLPQWALPNGIRHDFSTPEGAILVLEDAYRAKDIDAAVEATSFTLMAEALGSFPFGDIGGSDMARENTELVENYFERTFRQQIVREGFPDFSSLTCEFTNNEVLNENVTGVTQVCGARRARRGTGPLPRAQTPSQSVSGSTRRFGGPGSSHASRCRDTR